MSLRIEESAVTAVLLADGWHRIVDESFRTDSYEFLDGDFLTVGGGAVDGVPSTGFRFQEADSSRGRVTISGPLTAIFAVET